MKIAHRLVALLLVACLTSNAVMPAGAASLSIGNSVAISGFHLADAAIFQQEAFAARALDALHVLYRPPTTFSRELQQDQHVVPSAIVRESWWGRLFEAALQGEENFRVLLASGALNEWLKSLDEASKKVTDAEVRMVYTNALDLASGGAAEMLAHMIRFVIAPWEETHQYLRKPIEEALENWTPRSMSRDAAQLLVSRQILGLVQDLVADHPRVFLGNSIAPVPGEAYHPKMIDTAWDWTDDLRELLIDYLAEDGTRDLTELPGIWMRLVRRHGLYNLKSWSDPTKPQAVGGMQPPTSLQILYRATEELLKKLKFGEAADQLAQAHSLIDASRFDEAKNILTGVPSEVNVFLPIFVYWEWARLYRKENDITRSEKSLDAAMHGLRDLRGRFESSQSILEKLDDIELHLLLAEGELLVQKGKPTEIVPRLAALIPRMAQKAPIEAQVQLADVLHRLGEDRSALDILSRDGRMVRTEFMGNAAAQIVFQIVLRSIQESGNESSQEQAATNSVLKPLPQNLAKSIDALRASYSQDAKALAHWIEQAYQRGWITDNVLSGMIANIGLEMDSRGHVTSNNLVGAAQNAGLQACGIERFVPNPAVFTKSRGFYKGTILQLPLQEKSIRMIVAPRSFSLPPLASNTNPNYYLHVAQEFQRVLVDNGLVFLIVHPTREKIMIDVFKKNAYVVHALGNQVFVFVKSDSHGNVTQTEHSLLWSWNILPAALTGLTVVIPLAMLGKIGLWYGLYIFVIALIGGIGLHESWHGVMGYLAWKHGLSSTEPEVRLQGPMIGVKTWTNSRSWRLLERLAPITGIVSLFHLIAAISGHSDESYFWIGDVVIVILNLLAALPLQHFGWSRYQTDGDRLLDDWRNWRESERSKVWVPELNRTLWTTKNTLTPQNPFTRLFLRFILNNTALFREQPALEIGVGSGVLTISLARSEAKVTGVDVLEELVNVSRRNIALERPDVVGRVRLGLSDLYENLSNITGELHPMFRYIIFNCPILDWPVDSGRLGSYKACAGNGFSTNKQMLTGVEQRLLPGGVAFLVGFRNLQLNKKALTYGWNEKSFWTIDEIKRSLPIGWITEAATSWQSWSRLGIDGEIAIIAVHRSNEPLPRFNEPATISSHARSSLPATAA